MLLSRGLSVELVGAASRHKDEHHRREDCRHEQDASKCQAVNRERSCGEPASEALQLSCNARGWSGLPGVSEEGHSLEFFDMIGNTVAVVTLPASALRPPTQADRLAARTK